MKIRKTFKSFAKMVHQQTNLKTSNIVAEKEALKEPVLDPGLRPLSRTRACM